MRGVGPRETCAQQCSRLTDAHVVHVRRQRLLFGCMVARAWALPGNAPTALLLYIHRQWSGVCSASPAAPVPMLAAAQRDDAGHTVAQTSNPTPALCLRAVVLVAVWVNAGPPLLLLVLWQHAPVLQLHSHWRGRGWPATAELRRKGATGRRARLLPFVAAAVGAPLQALAAAILALPAQQASEKAHPAVRRHKPLAQAGVQVRVAWVLQDEHVHSALCARTTHAAPPRPQPGRRHQPRSHTLL